MTGTNRCLTSYNRPQLLLRGDTPRLIDEWQEYPEIWNYVRHEVDDRNTKGQFILTGSANLVTISAAQWCRAFYGGSDGHNGLAGAGLFQPKR
ncbi:MAG: AAA family ATPase [Lentimicrobium sp.]|nr:AAA family ATPase [Lentimicrobium sp.]